MTKLSIAAVDMNRKTAKMELLESQYGGKPIERVIADLTETTNSDRELARILGIGRPTLSVWRMRLGIEIGRKVRAA